MRPRLISTMVAFGILMLAGAQSAAAQTVPATLTGEIFTISPPQVATNCNPTGTSTVSYAVSGLGLARMRDRTRRRAPSPLGRRPSHGSSTVLSSGR